MFVPTLIIAICYITIVTVVWRKSSFTVSSRRSKAEDSCMELSTVVTKGQIKVFFSFNCIIYFQLLSAKNELKNIHGKSMVGTVHHLTHFYLKTWWIVTQNYRFFFCSLDKIILRFWGNQFFLYLMSMVRLFPYCVWTKFLTSILLWRRLVKHTKQTICIRNMLIAIVLNIWALFPLTQK